MSDTTLDSTVANLRTKADRYQEATNFEAKLKEYTSHASSAQSSVYGLQNRMEEMERFAAIYTEVFGENDDVDDPDDVIGTVEDARARARQVLDFTADEYWKLIDSDEVDNYEQKVQTARSKVNGARQMLRDALNRRQSYWEERVQTGRTVLSLMSNTGDAEILLNDIETFVTSRMWDDSNSITSLQADWQGVQRKLESGAVADWNEFKQRHNLSRETINLLKRLAEGERISLDELDRNRGIIDELLGVDDLRNALEVTL